VKAEIGQQNRGSFPPGLGFWVRADKFQVGAAQERQRGSLGEDGQAFEQQCLAGVRRVEVGELSLKGAAGGRVGPGDLEQAKLAAG
jgi:hypothetical protein